MVDATHKSFTADDRSYFSLIKKDIHKLATERAFPINKINEIDLIISELTSNLQKHTLGGAEILFGFNSSIDNPYIEIISIDNGPGITDTKRVMSDGYSSANTLGQGFGSMQRLSDKFDLYSLPKWGTIVLARVYKKDPPKKKENIYFHQMVLSKPGETTSGDGCVFITTKYGFKCLLADGLGHGAHANIAINQAAEAFRQCPETSAVGTIRYMHGLVKKTRGLVANVVIYNAAEKTWAICGVGNIATKLMGGLATKTYLPYNGIIGHNIPSTMNDTILSKEEYNQFISCSDGFKSKWDLQKFPMVLKHDLAILCAALYKEYARQSDDMSVITCKIL